MTEPTALSADTPSPRRTWLERLVNVEPAEQRALAWAFAYFFLLLCGYYILRPMRDEMGIAGGVRNLHWLFTGTFIAMLAAVPLFGWAARTFRPSRLLPAVYLFFIANIAVFYVLFASDVTHAWVARAFFIWVSVFNLFVVSVFWSFMADVFDSEQAKRLFGFVAAGGTAGALAGPAIAASLAVTLGPEHLLPVSAGCLALCLPCIRRLAAWRAASRPDPDAAGADPGYDRPMGGGILAGIGLVLRSPYLLGICLLVILFTTLATFLYFQQAEIVRDAFDDSGQRTAVFAAMDLAVNGLTILFQVFLTGRIVGRLGLAWTLALVPVALGLGFLVLGFAPLLGVLVAVQVLRRAGNYAIMRPAREMLYTVVGLDEKFKAKNFIDTAVYRGGDAVAAWIYAGLAGLGLGLSGIAFVAVPLAAVWAAVSFGLGRRRERMAASGRETEHGRTPGWTERTAA